MEKHSCDHNNFNEIVEKIVNIKRKFALKRRSYIYKTDELCARKNHPAATKAHDQSPAMKDPTVEEPKARA